jgi:3-methyladenine DNA glycosylase AlkD
MKQTVEQIKKVINDAGNPEAARQLQRFFKTGEGQYGEGDTFVGVKLPPLREIAKQYRDLSLPDIKELLHSPIHEHRMVALVIMVLQFKRGSQEQKHALYDLYLTNTAHINNWDLVDLSCRDIVGGYLADKSHQPLYDLARSPDLWERRIAMVSTWWFIREHDLEDTFAIAELLLGDKHDLIHKAVGWMLREAGKRDEKALKRFLDQHAAHMPRTALRYAIERFGPEDKMHYMTRDLIARQ